LYISTYDGKYQSFCFVATEKRYKNKVRNAEEFNYQEVSEEEIKKYGLYAYPEIDDNFNLHCILSDSSYKIEKEIQERYDFINGRLGMKKEVRL
jgi:hypothetical protein